MEERILNFARGVLEQEQSAIREVSARLNPSFCEAVKIVSNCRGKVVVSGMGKSGHIAKKIAATLSSVGTPSLFIHPAESSHGDMGVISNDDVVIAISYGGETSELFHLLRYVGRRSIPLIAMTGKPSSTLGKSANIVLDVSVNEEACPIGLAPTASTTATLALGDALAMTVLREKGFTREQFAEFHPSGSLGARLLTRVQDIMHKGAALPVVKTTTKMIDVVNEMTRREVRGLAGVLDDAGKLVGVVTDGDLRRSLGRSHDMENMSAADLMTKNPKTILDTVLAEQAAKTMQEFNIQVLLVVNAGGDLVGAIHFQDLLKARLV